MLAGGNWIIDQVKLIDVFPQPEQLANIRSQSPGTGGAPYNVLVNLAKLGAGVPLLAAGLVGKDTLGEMILEDCRTHDIDARHLRATADAATSYTDVMTEQSNGRAKGWTSIALKRACFTSATYCCSTLSMNRTPNSALGPPVFWLLRKRPG